MAKKLCLLRLQRTGKKTAFVQSNDGALAGPSFDGEYVETPRVRAERSA